MMKGLIIQQQKAGVGVEENMSNLTSASGEASVSSGNRAETASLYPHHYLPPPNQAQPLVKKKRNLPGNPDPDAEVIALSPKTLMATNRFICEICSKGFQRDQNLQLHRRGHNLPWKLKQRSSKEVRKKVYVCPESTCVHHHPSRALGDLTGIKKHFCRKHGEKKWKCDKCSKRYAVQSDWKAHSKICGTREYRCDCGTLFSRRDSFITHRAFCDALAEESTRSVISPNPLLISSQVGSSTSHTNLLAQLNTHQFHPFPMKKEHQNFINPRPDIPAWLACPPVTLTGPGPLDYHNPSSILISPTPDQRSTENPKHNPSLGPTLQACPPMASPHVSATALLQKAAQMGATMGSKDKGCSSSYSSPVMIGAHHAHVSDGFGQNLSSRDQMAGGFVPGLAPFGNKAAGASSAMSGHVSPPVLPPDMVASLSSSASGFDGSSFGDAGFEGGATAGEMTRDFLGLRPLSHEDMLNLAGFSNHMNHNQTHKSWQG